jgi:hypothetical protein
VTLARRLIVMLTIQFVRRTDGSEGVMPLVTAFNLRREDPLPEIEEAVRHAMTSIPALEIHDHEVDLVPIFEPEGFRTVVTRINIDLWERRARTKDALQDLAARVADSFQSVVGRERKVKVVIRPYDIGQSGWVSV